MGNLENVGKFLLAHLRLFDLFAPKESAIIETASKVDL
jgi:hypothetical protein